MSTRQIATYPTQTTTIGTAAAHGMFTLALLPGAHAPQHITLGLSDRMIGGRPSIPPGAGPIGARPATRGWIRLPARRTFGPVGDSFHVDPTLLRGLADALRRSADPLTADRTAATGLDTRLPHTAAAVERLAARLERRLAREADHLRMLATRLADGADVYRATDRIS